MKHQSRMLGSIEYELSDVYTFPNGLAGFEENRRYLLVQNGDTKPVKWLVSLEKDGPELALLDPALLMEYDIQKNDLRRGTLRVLGARSMDELRAFSVLTVPDQIRKASLNLRAPILLNSATRRGFQHVWPDGSRKPVRKQVYGDLVPVDPLDKGGMVITHRKVGETIEIGPDITVQVLELADGGVRLGVYAPRKVEVSRGRYPVTTKQENRRANEELSMRNVVSLMSSFRDQAAPRDMVARPLQSADGSEVHESVLCEQSQKLFDMYDEERFAASCTPKAVERVG